MKKNFLIIIVIALICMSCGHEERGKLTQRGKQIHDSWLMYTQQIIEKSIVPAFQMSDWISGNDSVRRVIEDNYFPYMRIRNENTNEYSLYNGAEKVLTVYTAGMNLDDNGASWIIRTEIANPGYDNGQRPLFMSISPFWDLYVTKISDQQWDIQMDTASSSGSECNWQLTLPASDTIVYFTQQEYTLAGNGTYKFSGDVYLHYNIDASLQHNGTMFPWYRGIISMTARYIDCTTNEPYTDDIHVKAAYYDDGEVKITYRDVTESWMPEIWYK